METSAAKPRVNGSMLPKHIGHGVSVVGKNLGFKSPTVLQLETSDKGQVRVQFQQPQRDPLSAYVEVIGFVQQDCSVAAERVVNYGSDFDLDTYNDVITLCAQFPAQFPLQ
ncbi:hypothetical protein EMCRGX_G012442 [Ephydatia muelleri]